MSALVQGIDAEAKAVARFVELLKEEQEILSGGAIGRLDGLVQSKNQVATELGLLAEQRNAFLTARGLAVDNKGVEAWLAAHPSSKASRDIWSRILALAVQARDLNRMNGELIQVRMQHNAQALEILLGASRQQSLYGPDGQSAPQNTRRINDSV
jgi:flagella synthesis protein FlgN